MQSQALSAQRAWLPRPTQTQRRCANRQPVVRVRAYLEQHSGKGLQQHVDRFVAAINSHDPAALCSLLSDKVVWSDRVWRRDDLVGHKRVARAHYELFSQYPDYRLHAEDVLARADSNTVALHWTATGTNAGEWRGHAPSGRRSTLSGVSLFVFDSERDDCIKEVITYRQANKEEQAHYMRERADS